MMKMVCLFTLQNVISIIWQVLSLQFTITATSNGSQLDQESGNLSGSMYYDDYYYKEEIKEFYGAEIKASLMGMNLDTFSRPRNFKKVEGNLVEQNPVEILSLVNILSIERVTTKSFDVSFVLRLEWEDQRLERLFQHFLPRQQNLVSFMEEQMIKLLWRPPVYFVNSMEDHVHDVLQKNQFMTLISNGTRVMYSIRIHSTVNCNMKLQKYPFDTQVCSLRIGLFGYHDNDIKLGWYAGPSALYGSNVLELEEFVITNITTTELMNNDSEIMFSVDEEGSLYGMPTTVLHLNLTMEHRLGYHVLQTYLPTSAIVVVSFFSFWIDRNAVPGRVALGITCILTMHTIASGLRARMPPVSYYTALDLWMIMCQCFVILALLEYIFVHFIAYKLPKLHSQVHPSVYDDYEPEQKLEMWKLHKSNSRKGARIERISRAVFPLLFLILLSIYFITYMVITIT